MLFPNPQSSRVLVRKTAAGVMTELGRVLGGEVEALLAEEARARQGIHEHVVFKPDEQEDELSEKERRVRRIAKRVVDIATRLREIEPSLDTARYEPQLTGIWPQHEYRNLLELERRMLASLVLLISSFEKLDTRHCEMLVHQTPYLNANFFADVFSTISIISSSLTSGTPLPPYLPQLTERLIYHAQAQHKARAAKGDNEIGSELPYDRRDGYTGVNGLSSRLGLGLDITVDMLLDEQLPAYSTAIVALSSIIFRVDAMTDIVKSLCGQATIPGYRLLQRDHLDWEETMCLDPFFQLEVGSPTMGIAPDITGTTMSSSDADSSQRNNKSQPRRDPSASPNSISDTEKQSRPPSHKPSESQIRKILFQPRRAYKTWIRCCVAFGATMILLVATKPSHVMGQAAFFAAIVAVMLPPTFALSVFFMAAFTLLFGMLIGWAWACAAMASALSVRSASLLAQQQQHLQSMLNPNSTLPIPVQIQVQTFHGIFLDPRSSAVYGAFLFIGTFALGVLRAYIPRLALMSIFGTIVMDVIATLGPLFPSAQYMLVKTFLIPATFYVAVAIGSLVLIFPESLNHVWLTLFQHDFISPTQELLTLLNDSVSTSPSDHDKWQELADRGNEVRGRLISGTENLLGQIGLIDLDTSVGRLGPDDLKKVCGELKGFLVRAMGLHSFHIFVNDKNKFDQETESFDSNLDETQDVADGGGHQNGNGTTKTTSNTVDSRHVRDTFHRLRSKIAQRELDHGHDFDSLVPLLASASLSLREACEEGVACLGEWVGRVNSHRWGEVFGLLFSFGSTTRSLKRKAEKEEWHREMEDVVRRLETRLNEFRTVERVKLVGPYEKFFDRETRKVKEGGEGEFTTRSLYISFVFIDTLDAFCESLIKTLRLATSIDSQRPTARLWFPGKTLLSPTKLKGQVVGTGGEGADNPMSMGTARNPTSFADDNTSRGSSTANLNPSSSTSSPSTIATEAEHVKFETVTHTTRNPDAFPPTSPFGRFYITLCSFFRFLKSPEGIFGIRMGVVSVALWVPSVCANSAWFYYEHKGMWALIMAQMALAVYAGDQIAGFLIRMVGTAIGLVIGMALWYIGAGRGHGNPYAIVIVTTVLLSPFLYLRIVTSPRFSALWIMIPVTGVFVAGYSWINANQFVIANPGIGVALGWKRALLVMIGFTAAFIVMIFPRLQSSRVLVRQTVSSVINELGCVLAGEIEAFLAEEARARKGTHEKVVFRRADEDDDEKVSPKERRVRRVGRRVVALAGRMREIAPSLETAKFEPQLSGVWPQGEYRTLLELQNRMLGALVLLISSFEKLDTKHCGMLVHHTPYLNPNFIADVFSTLSILSNSLQNGSPLPPYLPILRERLIYHEMWSGRGVGGSIGLSARTSLKKLGTPTNHPSVNNSRVESGEWDASEDGMAPERIDGVSMGLDEITLDALLDEQLPAYSSAVVALSSIVFRIDAMAGVVKTLCGETTIPGYANLQKDHLDWEEKMVAGHIRY
ncbi:hypothetical protein CVT24_006853 [Panaeolus cyanescens]|uniref:ER transporter 6TM N-terminal domain-containing protein n=1 Tax=Panaeolus cyanescens TaxID=181874 RepID=A0A409WC53_9AGAR|nr:hypothetical protein CVT24_006853 [Panaeolus cyanescens]